jgi:hypothetical protein
VKNGKNPENAGLSRFREHLSGNGGVVDKVNGAYKGNAAR